MVKQSALIVGFLALAILAIGLVSAVSSSNITYPSVVNNSQGYFNISFTLNNTDVTPANVSFAGSVVTGVSAVFAELSNITVQNNSTVLAVKRVNFNTGSTGSVAGTILIGGVPQVFTVTVQQTPSNSGENFNSSLLCSSGIKEENLSLSDLEDKSGLENDWEWKALDEIKIRVTLENTGDKDNEDYKVQLYFFDETGKDVSSKFVDDTDSLKQDVNNLDSEDDTDVDFTFKLSTDADSGDYTIVVKAIKKGDEKNQCDILEGDYRQVSIDQYDDYAIVTNVDAPVTVSCGSTVDVIVTVANTGSNDQDRIKVVLYNRDLGLNMYKEVDNMDSGDTTDVLFSFAVPQNAQEKLYRLIFSTEFNYDDHDESYDDQSDSEDDFVYSLNLAGDCIDYAKPTLSARLNSTAVVGEDLVVELSLKNNANSSISAIASADEYASWAELIKVEPTTLTIAKQETKKAYITFKPTQTGQQTFNINVVYNGKAISQPVTVNVASKTSWLSGAYEQFGQTGTYLLIGIIVLVVLIILVLIIRAIVSRKD